MYKLQSIIFNKNYNTLNDVVSFLYNNDYKFNKIDITKNYYRARQLNPKILKSEGYTNYHNKLIDPDKNIYLVLAYDNYK